MLTKELMALIESTVLEEFTEEQRGREIPCFVHHGDAGGQCERPSVMRIYGLRFCEVHGEEAKTGALIELYTDIEDVIGRLDNTQVPLENEGASELLGGVRGALGDKIHELSKGEDAALASAYPTIAERVCMETRLFEYGGRSSTFPEEAHADDRRNICSLMRQAHMKGMTWAAEALELDRESSSAQLAFAMEDREKKVAAIKKRRSAG